MSPAGISGDDGVDVAMPRTATFDLEKSARIGQAMIVL
jgi:hypothetical protein